ncbi:MAG: cytochrome C oxidase subunit IV family protein [Paracoccus sp. (in: a-proteobacteria)]|uniref:cytochrome C oxidase subunit IV family protein n=1 Tax=Paracoccus sp. TaxID=267 RepID=UPI0039E31D5D
MTERNLSIRKLIPARVYAVWAVLVALSILGPVLGVEGRGMLWAEIALLTLAVVKVRFVGLDFMELRHAPRPMRFAFEAYCLVLWGLIVGLYLGL